MSEIEFDGREFTGRLLYLGERLVDDHGTTFGYVLLYGPSLPASVLGLLTRGDARPFTRMAELAEPGRRQAAVLFADLEDSGAVSRRLPSAVYFELIRELVTAIDDAVVARRGLIGKHIGDGVTAFFLADEHGSRSAASRAALEVAQEIAEIAERIATQGALGACWSRRLAVQHRRSLGLDALHRPDRHRRRLEVAALDEFNEALRIQQSARGGVTSRRRRCSSGSTTEVAAAVGLEPQRMTYTTVAELPHAPRSAGATRGRLRSPSCRSSGGEARRGPERPGASPWARPAPCRRRTSGSPAGLRRK